MFVVVDAGFIGSVWRFPHQTSPTLFIMTLIAVRRLPVAMASVSCTLIKGKVSKAADPRGPNAAAEMSEGEGCEEDHGGIQMCAGRNMTF